MNRIQAATATMSLLLPFVATAGEVYGKVTSGGAPARESVTVSAKCGTTVYAPVPLDKTGSYHLVVNESGKCTLTVTQQALAASVDVMSFDDAVQADIVLTVEGGKLVARRK